MNFKRLLIVITALVALVGQATAGGALACEMASEAAHQSQQMDHSMMMHHGDMQHDDADSDHSMSHQSCCGDDCDCPSGACVSMTTLVSDTLSTQLLIPHSIMPGTLSGVPTSTKVTRFRPPIFA
ncbi:hypothetical protein [Aestuariibacter salexigens]|uniref:hypothetical protein n=1 Tax=Aestuariibacter salexigens TaxID=226010 RepID=UPI0003F66328|nr:hypothetical protein [Aestuariibacter salexigens]